MAENHRLYDRRSVLKYVSAEHMREILVTAEGFYRCRDDFERSGKGADVVLKYIETIRHSVPNEVRAALPENSNLSNSTLGKLEERCIKSLVKKSISE